MFKEIKASEIKDNLINLISKEWALLCAGDQDAYNMMTVSWGFAGELWGNDSVCVFVRPQRYTLEFTEKHDYFTLSFYGENKKIHSICGKLSGRDIDKTKECKLTPIFDDNSVYFDEARLVLVCKKQYSDFIKKENFIDREPLKNYENNDFHKMYIGKIEKVLIKR